MNKNKYGIPTGIVKLAEPRHLIVVHPNVYCDRDTDYVLKVANLTYIRVDVRGENGNAWATIDASVLNDKQDFKDMEAMLKLAKRIVIDGWRPEPTEEIDNG